MIGIIRYSLRCTTNFCLKHNPEQVSWRVGRFHGNQLAGRVDDEDVCTFDMEEWSFRKEQGNQSIGLKALNANKTQFVEPICPRLENHFDIKQAGHFMNIKKNSPNIGQI